MYVIETLGEYQWDGDELHIATRTGAIGIFFIDEPPLYLSRGSSVITKFLSKARA